MRLSLSVVAVFAIATLLPTLFQNQLVTALLIVPGTLLHELAHYGFALLLDGRPKDFSIWPTWSNGSIVALGHVVFYPNWWNAATVALSPLLVFPASIWLMVVGSRKSILINTVACYAAACGFYSMIPSSADVSIALSYPVSLLIAIPLLLGSTWVWFILIRREIRRQSVL
jgi:hypothetical protein